MFRVDRMQNRISRLDRARFGDLALRERDHLQEWLANQPDALGEELLIIQKEFDGFADTRERLDLLAMDEDGQLVVIENKLDDSGRDVAWQALKYAAYVSSLTKAQIINIYQQYLDRHGGGGDARQRICEFLEVDTLEDVVLNPGASQRLIFIAANFRKEITSTVLWLREHRIDARCFKVTPYLMGTELLVDIQPVIPTPEAAEFMISMAEKESEAKAVEGGHRHKLRLEFWAKALERLRAKGLSRYETVSPSKENWIPCGTGLGGVVYNISFTQTQASISTIMNSSSKERNKAIFDALSAQSEEINRAFGAELRWLRMDDNKMSCAIVSQPFDGFNREVWNEMADWMASTMVRLQAAFDGPIAKLKANGKFKVGPT
ncbi:MAG: DUF4268 domain-containing protein [Tabrizicola sp.]|uniref:DUF4268 domain-containing protein n=1 Tax=Tabrizicola sp. TaxID=2005166 RepID=UPI002733E37E|nr:DUF4268 domain-containing protein [Tabrizicola sp.]MDP3264396.1 DUF4268 domain-containing protein [Tabrizicola sp.]MDP3646442.1 DUF4268 domain-containing protein [Paracoccaceae bacterium]